MLEFFTRNDDEAMQILKHDHETVKGLFDEFEKAEKRSEKKRIAAKAIMELRIHATIEEELFYPALRNKKEVEKDLLNEADEEHHVAKLLIAELSMMDGSEDHYDAKFTVLAENIRHHIKEEEHDLFPQAHKTDVDFIALGLELKARKEVLKKYGVPPCAEEKMMAAHAKGAGDSPAKAAKTQKAPKLSKAKAATKKPSSQKSAIGKSVKSVAKKASAKKVVAKAKTTVSKLKSTVKPIVKKASTKAATKKKVTATSQKSIARKHPAAPKKATATKKSLSNKKTARR